jgi:hypothetical protein
VLALHYAIEAVEELYVADRLWDRDDGKGPVRDPFGVYRFVHDDTLRLVFDQAPLLRGNPIPRNVYKPYYSRVVPGVKHEREVEIRLPVDEYSSLARDIEAPTTLVQVSRVQLIIAFRLRSSLESDPRAPRGDGEGIGYIVHDPRHMISSVEVGRLSVRRRSDPIARPILPGDAPLPPAP